MDALYRGWEMLHGISRFRNNKTQYEMRKKTKKDLRDSLPRGFFLFHGPLSVKRLSRHKNVDHAIRIGSGARKVGIYL